MSDANLAKLASTGVPQAGTSDVSGQLSVAVSNQPQTNVQPLVSGSSMRGLVQTQQNAIPIQAILPVEFKGWLYKWTNYIKGYQKRWFILENGYLRYYRNQAEVAYTCRGTMNLATATIQHDDSLSIILQNGATSVFHLKAATETERQQWLGKLQAAHAHASQSRSGSLNTDAVRSFVSLRNRYVDEDEDDEEEDGLDAKERDEAQGLEFEKQLSSLSSKMDDLHTCYNLICKHHGELVRILNDQTQPLASKLPSETVSREKELSEKLALFKITAQTMLNASQEYYDTATQQGRKWQRLLEREHEQRLQFEGVVEQMARQHRQLERQVKSARAISPTPPDDGTSTSVPVATGKGALTSKNGAAVSAPAAAPKQLAPLKITAHAQQAPKVARGSESEEDEANGDFYDALDIEAPSAVAPASYFKLSTLPTDADDTLSTDAAKSSKAAVVHQRSQSDWSSEQQTHGESASGSSPTSPQRSQSKQSVRTAAAAPAQPDAAPAPASTALVRADGPFTVSASRRKPRRTAIPFKPASSLNLWSIIKNCVGKELSKIPFPVNFSEPISMLQRLVEDLEYSQLLDLAAECTDPVEQMAFVAVFNVSSYRSTADRVTKPFNPVLGETYELDRTDDEYGWRMIAEQVSHHPPSAAFHCESAKWVCYEEFTLGSKFRGMYLQVQPLGCAHCEFKRDGNHYTWSRVTTMVHNIIVGKLWIDNIGECVVANHTLGIRCFLKFVQYTYFRSDLRRVLGVIKDRNDEARYILFGTWDDKMEGAKLKRPPPGSRNPYANLDPDGVPKVWQSLDASEKKLLWRSNDYPPNSDKMYNFTTFALQLNEPESGVAPTDSRNRPDQRLMEQAQWDTANLEKPRIEEKQRAARRALEKQNEQRALNGLPPIVYQPAWFKRQHDLYTDQTIFVYAGEYWDCKRRSDWSRSPELW